ncbi:hypothetical protein QBC43DRAFT_293464 [Cladorrhinum sp. PSN259]|nr:hypothetical protein QBC43DRAFT_293464 [Cladorrhinum sp. PSN259]
MASETATPGIFWANSGVMSSKKEVLPYETYAKWYEDVHIPDWMGAKPGAITAAWRYQSLDPDRASSLPFLVLYKYPDIISDISAPEFRTVRLDHDSPLPGGGPVNSFAQFEVLAGSHVETWRASAAGDDRGPLLVTETIAPCDIPTEEFNTWYRESHINEITKLEGWRRTTLFDGGFSRQPKWFALHEFEDDSFGSRATEKFRLLLVNSTGPKIGDEIIKKADLAIWKLIRVYGDATTSWGRQGGDKIIEV